MCKPKADGGMGFKDLKNGFKNRYNQRTGMESDFCFMVGPESDRWSNRKCHK